MAHLNPKDTMNTALGTAENMTGKDKDYPKVFEPAKRDPGAQGVGDRIRAVEVDPYHASEQQAGAPEQLCPGDGDNATKKAKAEQGSEGL